MVDAVVVGAGPNGLAAAVTLARAGLSVEVVERNDTIGGGARTAELTLPGFHHDVCSAVHPMALQSEFFRRFRMEDRIELRLPDVQYGHPLDGGRAGIAYRDLERTAEALGVDGPAFRNLMAPLSRNADQVADFATDALLHVPHGTADRGALRPARAGAGERRVEPALPRRRGPGDGVRRRRALHPAHAVAVHGRRGAVARLVRARPRWPVPIGGSQAIVDALAADLVAHGGTIETGREVRSLADLTPAKAVLFDTSVPGMLGIAGKQIPTPKRGALRRFRFGNAAAKVDFALSDPVPWTNTELRGRGRSTSAAPGRRSPRRSVRSRTGSTPSGRTCSGRSRRSSTGSCAAREARLLGVRARTGGIRRRPHRRDRPAGRAVRPRLPRHDPAVGQPHGRADGRVQPQLRRRRHRRRGRELLAARQAARPVVRPLAHGRRHVPVLGGVGTRPGVHGMAGWHAARSALTHTFGLSEHVDLEPED